jgi:hypothetical protein
MPRSPFDKDELGRTSVPAISALFQRLGAMTAANGARREEPPARGERSISPSLGTGTPGKINRSNTSFAPLSERTKFVTMLAAYR